MAPFQIEIVLLKLKMDTPTCVPPPFRIFQGRHLKYEIYTCQHVLTLHTRTHYLIYWISVSATELGDLELISWHRSHNTLIVKTLMAYKSGLRRKEGEKNVILCTSCFHKGATRSRPSGWNECQLGASPHAYKVKFACGSQCCHRTSGILPVGLNPKYHLFKIKSSF